MARLPVGGLDALPVEVQENLIGRYRAINAPPKKKPGRQRGK